MGGPAERHAPGSEGVARPRLARDGHAVRAPEPRASSPRRGSPRRRAQWYRSSLRFNARINARAYRAGGGVSEVLVVVGAPGRSRTCDPRIRSPMLYPTELQARAGILAGYGAGVKCGGVCYARNYARQLAGHVLAVGGAHDVVAIEHRARLVARDSHRHSLDDASVHHVADGGSPEVVGDGR